MRKVLALLVLPLVLSACPKKEEALSYSEAKLSVEETSAASSAEGLTSVSVDISTNFTLGQGAQAAAGELRTFLESELPCASVALDGNTLSIEYGVNPGTCSYRGHEFSGTHSITVEKNDNGQVEVDHEWTALSNGVVELDGTAHVTWDFDAKTRRVEHQTTWTHLASGRVGQGSGDRTQSVLAGGLAEGIQIDGSRSWKGERGEWDLAIDGVQMRWIDPIPQAGTYTLSTPFDKTVSMSFTRVDDDTISVKVSGPKHSFSFSVSKLGSVSSDGA